MVEPKKTKAEKQQEQMLARLSLWKEYFEAWKKGEFNESERKAYLRTLADEDEKFLGKANFEYDTHDRLFARMREYNRSDGKFIYCCDSCHHRGYFAAVQGDYYFLTECECIKNHREKVLGEDSSSNRASKRK